MPSPPDFEQPTLRELAAAASAGEERAFEAVYGRLHGGLCRFLRRRGAIQDYEIEEVAQRTWVEVWRGLRAGRYDPQRGSISTFVYAIGHHVYLQYRRQTGRFPSSLNHELSPVFEPSNQESFSEKLELLEALRACLTEARLTPAERQVLDGMMQNQTERRMADKIGLAPSTINSRKRSALEKLRACLRVKGFPDESIERASG